MDNINKLKEISKPDQLFITVKEMCNSFGIPQQMAYKLIHVENFPVIFNGKKALIIKSKVNSWLESNTGIVL